MAAKAKTDADGKFEVKGIESASYRFSIKPTESKRWVRVFMRSSRLLVKPGDNKRIGTVRLNDRFRKPRK